MKFYDTIKERVTTKFYALLLYPCKCYFVIQLSSEGLLRKAMSLALSSGAI